MTDYATFGHGGVTFPLTSPSANTLLRDADPTVYYCLDFFAAVLQTHMGTRLVEAATEAGVTSITQAVAYKTPVSPVGMLTQAQFKFPLLALERKEERMFSRTVTWRAHEATFELAYVLAPMTVAQLEGVAPALRLVGRILDDRIERGSDPGYQSGAKIMTLAGLEQIELQTAKYGAYEATEGLLFPAYVARLVVRERARKIAGVLQALEGIDTAEDILADDDTTVGDVVETSLETT